VQHVDQNKTKEFSCYQSLEKENDNRCI